MSLHPDGTGHFGSNILEALHRSRRQQARRVLAGHKQLLAGANETAGPVRMGRMPEMRAEAGGDGSMRLVPARFGALLGTIAIVLIALHAICAAVIIDRAFAHVPASAGATRIACGRRCRGDVRGWEGSKTRAHVLPRECRCMAHLLPGAGRSSLKLLTIAASF